MKEAAAPYFFNEAAAPTIKMKMNQDARMINMKMKMKERHGKQDWLNATSRHFRSIVHCSRALSKSRGQLNWAMKEAAAAPTMKMTEDETTDTAWKARLAECGTEALPVDCPFIARIVERSRRAWLDDEGF